MDVPLLSELPVIVFVFADLMPFPGAKKSMHSPKLDDLPVEKNALESSVLVAPTVIALVAEAGDVEQASESEFPPATTMATPAATALFTAVLIDPITTAASMLGFKPERCRLLPFSFFISMHWLQATYF